MKMLEIIVKLIIVTVIVVLFLVTSTITLCGGGAILSTMGIPPHDAYVFLVVPLVIFGIPFVVVFRGLFPQQQNGQDSREQIKDGDVRIGGESGPNEKR